MIINHDQAMYKHFLFFLILSLLISCNTNRIDSKSFLFEMELNPDNHFPLYETFLPLRMYVNNDYLILAQGNTGNYSPEFFFVAYSLSDYSYKGSFGLKGRGPGEWIYPIMIRSSFDSPFLYLTDLSFLHSTATIYKMVLDSTIRLREVNS